MRIESMTSNQWHKVIDDIHDNSTTFHGRKILYIKPGELEWFENEQDASNKGFHPAQLNEIAEIAAQQLNNIELDKLKNEYSSLIEIRKAENLLQDPNSSPEALRFQGNFMIAKGKKTSNPTLKALGQKCLHKAINSYTKPEFDFKLADHQ